MKNFSIALPFWARAFLLAGLAGVVLGAGLIAYRFYDRPTTLSVAVGSFDGEAARIASIIAARLDATKTPVRLKIVKARMRVSIFRWARCAATRRPTRTGRRDIAQPVRPAPAYQGVDERGRTRRDRKPGRPGAGCGDGERDQKRKRTGYFDAGLIGAAVGGFDPSPPADVGGGTCHEPELVPVTDRAPDALGSQIFR
jgi:hypothetical protein